LAFGVAPIAAKVTSPVFVPERLEPVIPAVQAKAPVAFVTVHPVDPTPPPIRIFPVEVPFKFNAPDDPPSRLKALAPVEVTVPAAAKVNAVADTPTVSIEATPVRAPAVVTLSPPFDVSAKVPVEFPIAVFPVEAVFKLSVGAVIAAVPEERVCVSPVSPVEEIDPAVDVRFRAPVV
jgi:hypothetical protein